MKIEAVVIQINGDGTAVVQTKRKSACAECHKESCGMCDLFLGDDRFTAKVKNPIGAVPGDTVCVQSPDKNVIFNALLVFILPLLCAFVSFAVARFAFSASESVSALIAIGAVILCFAGIYLYSEFYKGVGDKIYITEIIKHNEEKM